MGEVAQRPGTGFDLGVLVRFAELAVEGLGRAREEIDALNVYPVPDGDTGTNMYLTLEGARDALTVALAGSGDAATGGSTAGSRAGGALPLALAAYARGALLGARGSSGVILSQLVGALLRALGRAAPDADPVAVFAAGMRAASDAAWAAVGEPVEGTILSVARAAADAAEATGVAPATLVDVVRASACAAREALARTPGQMALLREAGVVDAGGRGLCVVLDSAEAALTGRHPRDGWVGGRTTPRSALPVPLLTDDLRPGGPAYEVMYLLEAPDDAVPTLRTRLLGLGDSLVVVGGEGLWNVHVHTDDVGAAVEAGIGAGTPSRIRVTHFAEQVALSREAREERRRRGGRAVVAVAAGPGLARIFGEAGAHVVETSPGRRASTGEILRLVEASGAAEVVVLPNDAETVGVAEAAASAAGDDVRVIVVPTRAQVQGLAALAVHEPGRPLDSDVVRMTDAARGARHGAVTVAARQAMTSAGPCEPGDVLGAIGGDFVSVGDDRPTVATGLLDRLLGDGGELVTLVGGADGGDLARLCEEHVLSNHPGVDVVVYDGGQERYLLLLGVE